MRHLSRIPAKLLTNNALLPRSVLCAGPARCILTISMLSTRCRSRVMKTMRRMIQTTMNKKNQMERWALSLVAIQMRQSISIQELSLIKTSMEGRGTYLMWTRIAGSLQDSPARRWEITRVPPQATLSRRLLYSSKSTKK